MRNLLDNLYEMCETLSADLEKENHGIRKRNGELDPSRLEYVDHLTHAIKSVKTTIAMVEAEDEGGYYGNYGRDNSNRSGSDMGGDYNRGEGTYRRGRGRNARRDSRGRYAREGYYRDADEMVDKLRDMMDDMPNEQTKQRMRQLVQELEQM